jgi:hypothetical protein
MKVLNNLDLNKNELQNAVAHKLAAAPSNPRQGQEYFNSTEKKKYLWDGVKWVDETSQGKTYTFSNGLTESGNNVTANLSNASPNMDGEASAGTSTTISRADHTHPSDTTKVNVADIIDNLTSTETDKPLSANQGRLLKANIDGKPFATAFTNIQTMVEYVNGLNNTQLVVAWDLYVKTKNVPDWWVYSVEATSVPYTYTTDQDFINEVETNGTVQVGYYKIAELETKQIELSNYVQNTRKVAGKTLENDVVIASTDLTDSNSLSRKFTATSPAMATSGGICSWQVNHNLNSKFVNIDIFETSSGEKVIADVVVADVNNLTIKFVSDVNLELGTFNIIING